MSHANIPTPDMTWMVACHQHDLYDKVQNTIKIRERHTYGMIITAFVANNTEIATVQRSTVCKASNLYLIMLVTDIARNGRDNRSSLMDKQINAGERMNMKDQFIGHFFESVGHTHFDKGLLYGLIIFKIKLTYGVFTSLYL